MTMLNESRICGLVFAAAVAAFAHPASAQLATKPAVSLPPVSAPAPAAPAGPATIVPTYNAIDADTLTKVILSQSQAQVTPMSDSEGTTTLKVQLTSGVAYAVFMDDCDAGQPPKCKSLEFRATLPPGALNFAQINSFNENMRYATAYLSDKGVPQLRMDANIRGGVTADFVAYSVRIFTKVFSDYIAQAKP
jgi:hypothetical protein